MAFSAFLWDLQHPVFLALGGRMVDNRDGFHFCFLALILIGTSKSGPSLYAHSWSVLVCTREVMGGLGQAFRHCRPVCVDKKTLCRIFLYSWAYSYWERSGLAEYARRGDDISAFGKPFTS